MTEFAIEAVGLQKAFKGHEALSGLNLNVPHGSISGFLGRNGAGKTTTIRILMGLAKADHGSARIFGIPPGDGNSGAAIRRRIGFVTEDKELYPYMTVAEIIRFSRPFFPKWRDDLERRYLNVFDLPPNKKISDLSKGMRSKLMLLLAISHGAELLVLDEPTDGLDPVALEEVLRELVALSASDGTTIFFSSHQLAEVEQIADQITIIDRGRAIVGGGTKHASVCYLLWWQRSLFPAWPQTLLPRAQIFRQKGWKRLRLSELPCSPPSCSPAPASKPSQQVFDRAKDCTGPCTTPCLCL
jgi:ABC-2 type transport system ATP-binding protein